MKQERGPRYIKGLDGLRAISILLVIVGHSGFERAPGSLGVTIFFFISGYLITTILFDEYTNEGSINIRHFYIRRFARLFPEQFAYVLISAFIVSFYRDSFRVYDYLSAITYTTNYLNIFTPPEYKNLLPFSHFWSLAVEEHFYLVWPVLLATISFSYRKSSILLFSVLLLSIVVRFIGIFLFWFSS